MIMAFYSHFVNTVKGRNLQKGKKLQKVEIVEQQRLRKFWLNWPPTPSPEIFLCFNWEWRKGRKRQIIFFLNKFFPFSLEPLRWPLFNTGTHTLFTDQHSLLLHTFIHHPPSLSLSLLAPQHSLHISLKRTPTLTHTHTQVFPLL